MFEKSVAKITVIKVGLVAMRKFSKGNVPFGYDWQHATSIKRLNKLFADNKVRIIPPREVLMLLFANFEGAMPMRDVNR